jgi:hypothetical protein
MLTVGMSGVFGGDMVGLGPIPACSGNLAASPQALRRNETDPMINKFVLIFTGKPRNDLTIPPAIGTLKADDRFPRRQVHGHARRPLPASAQGYVPETGLAPIRHAA